MVAQHSDLVSDSPTVAVRRGLAAALAPHLVAMRNLTDPSPVVRRAAGVPLRYGVAAEPLRGPVQRAMALAWRCAAAPGSARMIEVDHLDPISSVVQLHGADWSLVARTGGPAMLLFDGYPTAVVDVSATDLVGSLIEELVRAAGRRHEESWRATPRHEAPPAPARRHGAPTPVASSWVPEQRAAGGGSAGGFPESGRGTPPAPAPGGPRHGRP